MSKEIKYSTVMTRQEAKETNKEIRESNKVNNYKIGKFILSESQMDTTKNISNLLVITSIVGFIYVMGGNPLYTSNLLFFIFGLISVFLTYLTIIITVQLGEDIQQWVIEHTIYKDDIFKLQENKFQTPCYIRIIDCDYIKGVYLTETLLPKEQQSTRLRFLTDGGLTPNRSNHNIGNNKPDTVVMTSEEILRKGELVSRDDSELEGLL